MDNDNFTLEQPQATPETETAKEFPPATDKEAEGSIGKFKSQEALLNAYNSLEAEFTKRSQQLKELKKTEAPERDWDKEVKGLLEDYPVAKDMIGQIEAEIKNRPELLSKNNTLELALLSCLTRTPVKPEKLNDTELFEEVKANENVMSKLIGDYFDKVPSAPRTISGGGKIVVSAPKKATTIAEAGLLAEQYLKSGK